jgi:hypothetical protein
LRPGHFCFRVSDTEFDLILGRLQAAGIEYRSSVRGPVDMKVNTDYGGEMLYWNEPAGHQWEILTVSYACRPGYICASRPTPTVHRVRLRQGPSRLGPLLCANSEVTITLVPGSTPGGPTTIAAPLGDCRDPAGDAAPEERERA